VGQSQYLWKLEQPAHAVANGYFMGCINRVGKEAPWNLGEFYGTSYFVNPLGEIFSEASQKNDELLIAEFDLDLIDTVRSKWQFFRDRRPETYGAITQL
jgi:N-carbamoylputrescine amidase